MPTPAWCSSRTPLSRAGELEGRKNGRELFDLRNFMGTLRGTGVDTGSPSTFSAADARSCTNRLDGLLRRNTKPWTDKA
jgi:uncharacterized protein YaiI (UPF0178 family)